GRRGKCLRDAPPARPPRAAPARRRRSGAPARGRGPSSRDAKSWLTLLCRLDAGHLAERREETGPVGALIGQHAAAGFGNPVVAGAGQARGFQPTRPYTTA